MRSFNVEHRSTEKDCPSQEVLADFALGKLPLPDIETVGKHQESCEYCQQTLETFDQLDDSFVRDLKDQPTPVPVAVPPELEREIRAAEEISRIVWHSALNEQATDTEHLPRLLGQYELLERVGRGGMGVVYKALHLRLKRRVALKLLSPHRLLHLGAVHRFQREMEAVATLDHPHIVRALDANEVEGEHFLVMEFVEGTSLARYLEERSPIPVAEACEYVRQAALGLQAAFECGLVHRDIKPHNLMRTPGGQVKILDFGLAGLSGENESGSTLTGYGQGLGTPDYMAPEQIRDAHAVDIRADIYSLGCTLYFLLAGQPPFPEGSPSQKLAAHLERFPRPLNDFRSDLPNGVIEVVSQMMARDPAQRYQTPAEVAGALGSLTTCTDLPRGKKMRRAWLLGGLLGMAVLTVAGGLTISHLSPFFSPAAESDHPLALPPVSQPSEKPSGISDPGKPADPAPTPEEEGQSPRPDKKIDAKSISSPDGRDFVN